ncbi:ATP-binding protein, partial [Burkholderia vietnamiensis]|uniref:ATP-binding protein n=1 Tax=Burkholderia vietnamiensis TaxID=60552 RepID=UPI002ED9A394
TCRPARSRRRCPSDSVAFHTKRHGAAFEPYVTTKAKGTGLGLAMVKKIVDEHGARIDLRNRMHGEIVEGAQVSILFLQMASDAPGAEPGAQGGTAPANTKASVQTKAA